MNIIKETSPSATDMYGVIKAHCAQCRVRPQFILIKEADLVYMKEELGAGIVECFDAKAGTGDPPMWTYAFPELQLLAIPFPGVISFELLAIVPKKETQFEPTILKV